MDLETLGSSAISEDSPAGADVRYEPEFEELQAEIDKMSAPTASGGVDWKRVVKLSSEILASKSKDLLVASYLAVGLIRTQGAGGFCTGVKILKDMLETHWEKLFPKKKRMRGRIAAIEWWAEKTEAALEAVDVKGLERPRVEQLKEDMEKLASLVSELFPEPPSIMTIQRFVEAIPLEEEKEEPPPAEPSEKPEPQPARPTPTAPPEAEITSPKEAERAANRAFQELRQAASFLWEQDKSDPRPYRWRRIATWANVDGPPPATDGKTMLPPPPAQVKSIFEKLHSEADWVALLDAAEPRCSEFIFWLDLHYYAAEAMGQMGPNFEAAREAVCRETAYFLLRVPGIEELEFSDGTPFADAPTKAWLRDITLARGEEAGQGTAPLSPEGASLDAMVSEELKQAQWLVKKRKLADAVRLLHTRVRESGSRREEMLWRLALCQVLVQAKKVFLAAPHVERIMEDVDNYGVEEWDPELALRALTGALTVYERLGDDQARQKAESALARIARLDPALALKFKKK